MAKMNAFKDSIAYGIFTVDWKKVIKKNISWNGYFFLTDFQIYFKIDGVQAIYDINKLC